MKPHVNIEFNIEVWQENTMFVAYVPQLDLSSCGETMEKARRNIREAVSLYIEESQKMGTLRHIFESSYSMSLL